MLIKKNTSPAKEIYLADIAKGLYITMKNMLFAKKVTIQYPEERRKYSERFRGLHYIKATNGVENCTACMLCPTVCPAECIHIEAGERPDKEKYPVKFEIDLLRCCFCGMCEEACPKDAIKLSQIYDMSVTGHKILDKSFLLEQRGEQVMDISPFFFYLFAGAAVLCSLMVILNKNPASSAFSLVLAFFCFAGIYGMLGAHLIAALQVLVYAGAIMVLFVFVIMLLGEDQPSLDSRRTHPLVKALAAFLGIALFGIFAWAFKSSPITGATGAFTPEAIEAAGGNTRVVSELMFSEYILPFELTSILLLAAIVGAVAIAKRKPLTQAKTGAEKRAAFYADVAAKRSASRAAGRA